MEKLKVIETGILSVNDIDKLKEFPRNYAIQRVLNDANVKRIEESMNNIYVPSVIKVNQNWYILDGQHSKQAIKQLNLKDVELVYVMYDTRDLDRDVCIALNTTSKKWTTDDFLNLYCASGNPTYIWIKQMREQFQLGHNALMSCIFDCGDCGDGSYLKQDYINGRLYISQAQKDTAYKILTQLQDIRVYINRKDPKLSLADNLTKAFFRIAHHPQYSHTRMLQCLAQDTGSIYKCRNKGDYIEMFENIYNYRKKNKVNFM